MDAPRSNMADLEEKAYRTVVDRYYTAGYRTDVQGRYREDLCILQHSNKVCIVTLAASHPLVADGKSVARVDFQVTEKVNRLDNKVIGKGKRGGQWLQESSPLCRVTCTDDTEFTLYSCIKGKLVEVNENLINSPQLLTEKPSSEGYVAIVLPKFGESDKEMARLLSPQQYRDALARREREGPAAAAGEREDAPSCSKMEGEEDKDEKDQGGKKDSGDEPEQKRVKLELTDKEQTSS
ncbi:PREDICTED: protein Simiate-like [Branchiostoma belcheri]|uniref:Protein Abitram n=1 Tax=Branchiostoma belcheri TaxID=7741 RepID=A0A6P4ZEI1_BRABE|nr:PREDICTED: protein Simiate-like [Branchiostoma belcheri]